MRNVMQRQSLILLTMTTLLATACAGYVSDPGPGKRVQVTLTRDAYLSGETVTYVLRNVSNVVVEYAGSRCQSVLQQLQKDGTWTTVDGPARVCTLELAYLGAGQSVPLGYRLPQGLPNNLYRIALPEPTPENAPAPENAQRPALSVTSPPFRVNSLAPSQP